MVKSQSYLSAQTHVPTPTHMSNVICIYTYIYTHMSHCIHNKPKGPLCLNIRNTCLQ